MLDTTGWIAVASLGFCLFCLGLFNLSHRPTSLARAAAEAQVDGRTENIAKIFWLALALRLIAAIAISMTGTADFFAPDHWAYEVFGQSIADSWSGRGFLAVPPVQLNLYHYYNAIFFYVFGDLAPWFVRAMNATIGAVAVIIVFEVTRQIYGRMAARRAAWFVALFPSLILWSALNIKDAWAGLSILMIVWAALLLREKIRAGSVALLVLGLALLGGIRGYMFLLIAAGVVLSYLATIRGNVVRNYIAGLIVAIAFLYLYTSLGFGKQMLDTASFESLNSQRQGMTAGADSAFYSTVDISTPEKAFAFLPIGMTFFLFAPFPWMLSNFRQLITLPEMAFWWFLAFRYLLPGIRGGLRVRADQTITVVSVALISTMAYGLVEGNVGTAYRHRAQVLPLLLVLTAGGWAAKRRARSERAGFGKQSAQRSDDLFAVARRS